MKILDYHKIKVTSEFGTRIHPITGKESKHNGVDISCPVGTKVFSPVAAEVKFIKTNSATAGIYVVLCDLITDDRYDFMHLSKVLCRKGDIIQKGQEIALSGNTGQCTGPHLHYGRAINCRWNNIGLTTKQTYIDPFDMIEFEI